MDKDYIKSIQEYIVSSYREFEIIYSISNTQKYKRLSLYFEDYDIEIKIKWDIGTENLQVRFKSNSENENLQYEDSMSNIEACADLNSLITSALPNDKLREVLQSKNCKTLVKFYILYGNKPTNEIDYITTVSTAPEDKLTKFYIEHNTDTLIKKLAEYSVSSKPPLHIIKKFEFTTESTIDSKLFEQDILHEEELVPYRS